MNRFETPHTRGSHEEEESAMLFEKIDRKSADIMSALAQAPVYAKFGTVNARPAVPGEKITTTLASGAKETDNAAEEGDWVVTNPSGERYVLKEKQFSARYETSELDGVFKAKGSCRAIKNPFGKPIEIMASWGAPQTGDENCLIADTCDEHGGTMGGEPYLIDGKAFAETYK